MKALSQAQKDKQKELLKKYQKLRISLSTNIFLVCLKEPLPREIYGQWKAKYIQQFRADFYAFLKEVEAYYDDLYPKEREKSET